MKYLVVFAIAFACWACPAFAQHPGARMFPDSNFPGNDLYDVRSGSPEECADRCSADGRCRAFTFAIDQGRCYMKWGASGFTGSSSAVSGIIELHGGMPAQGTSDRYDPPPSYQPAAPPVVLGPPSRCSAKGNDTCPGCSISCPAGQQASCKEGEVHQTDGFSPVCWTRSSCTCSH